MWRTEPENGHDHVAISQAAIGRSIAIINGNGTTEILQALFQAAGGPVVPEKSSLQVGFVGLRIDSACRERANLFLRAQPHPDLTRDSFSNMRLQSYDVSQLTVV